MRARKDAVRVVNGSGEIALPGVQKPAHERALACDLPRDEGGRRLRGAYAPVASRCSLTLRLGHAPHATPPIADEHKRGECRGRRVRGNFAPSRER